MSSESSDTASSQPQPRGRRAWRFAFASLSMISFALCAASVGLWVRGYTTADTVMWRTGHPVDANWHRMDYMSRSLHGRLVFWRSGRVMDRQELGDDIAGAHAKLENEQTLHHWANEIRIFRRTWPAPAEGFAGVLGFRWQSAVGGSSARLGVPMWLFVTVTSVIPALRLQRWIRNRKRPGSDADAEEVEGAVPA